MKAHWENVYQNKTDQEVSWYQDFPETSHRLIQKYHTQKTKPIIDVGGGNSNLSHELQKSGYENITVLDISGNALKRTQEKMGTDANQISWIEENITEFNPSKNFHLWHDRAVFHFLTENEDRKKYLKTLSQNIPSGGIFILGTFSTSGPKKCSGLEICQYDVKSQEELFGEDFALLESFEEIHTTPFNTTQAFLFSVWKRK